MKQNGYYGYVKANTNIKTKYQLEFTRDKKVFDIMGTSKFEDTMLDKRELDFLEDAINLYNVLYYDESVLHVMLFEQIILNDEIILEQCKDMTSISILSQHTQKRISQVENINNELIEQNKKIELALSKYGMTINSLIKG